MSPPTFDDRQPTLISRRNLKMARSAHAYVRGNTAKFYEWLESADHVSLPAGPPIWICGDCHVGNLGPVANAKGRIEVQIRDLDQTVIGNPAHDLVRLGLSLATAARGSDLPGVTTAHIIEQMMEGYQQAITDAQPAIGKADHPKAVRLVMRHAIGRSWKDLALERLEGIAPEIPLGKRFWPLVKAERAEIEALFESENVRRLVTALKSRDDDAKVEVLDAAYWMKGCSSLGRLRYAVLVAVDGGKGKSGDFCLMDIKEAVRAAAPRNAKAKMPRDNAERVVEGARNLAPYLGTRMLAARMMDRSIVMRELMPQDLKVEIDRLTRGEAVKAARFLAGVVGKAHARQMDEETSRAWHAELSRNRSKTLDAPSWLWSAIVELVAGHEAAYLDHCRRYAMESAAA